MPTNLPKCEKYLGNLVLTRELRFVPFSRSEILESIPTILKSLSPPYRTAQIGQYHESDFGLPGELAVKGARPHSLYTSAAC